MAQRIIDSYGRELLVNSDGSINVHSADSVGQTPKGFQSLTVSSSAIGLTVPTGASWAYIIREDTNGVRYRDDGTNPTAAVGAVLPTAVGGFQYTGLLSAIKFIRSGSSDAVLDVLYYA